MVQFPIFGGHEVIADLLGKHWIKVVHWTEFLFEKSSSGPGRNSFFNSDINNSFQSNSDGESDGYMQNIHALHGGVPARCTPVAQQYDAGIIAMVKGKLLCDQLQCCVLTYVMAGQMRGRRKMTCNLYATDMH